LSSDVINASSSSSSRVVETVGGGLELSAVEEIIAVVVVTAVLAVVVVDVVGGLRLGGGGGVAERSSIQGGWAWLWRGVVGGGRGWQVYCTSMYLWVEGQGSPNTLLVTSMLHRCREPHLHAHKKKSFLVK
jgi:hypothetical protein